MSFGVGTGINLGTAVVYLFADGSGLAKGLNAAGNALANFKRKGDQVGAATAKALSAQQGSTKAQTELVRANNAVTASYKTMYQAQAAAASEQAKVNAATATAARFSKDYRSAQNANAHASKQVALATLEHRRALDALKAAVASGNTALIASRQATVDSAKASLEAARNTRLATKAKLDDAGIARRSANEALAAAKQQLVAAQNMVKAATAQVQANERAAASARKNAAAQLDAANKAKQAATIAVQAQQEALKGVNDSLLSGFQSAATVVAAAIATAVGATTKQFIAFEEQMYNVASISHEVGQDMGFFTAEVQKLSVELGKSPRDLAEGLYVIAQAAIKGKEGLEVLAVAAKAAVAGFTDVETATRPIIGVLNSGITDLSGNMLDAADASDILFESVTAGVFSFEDLASQVGDNLSLAQSQGVALEELSAAYVVLTKRSNSLAESTTQINAIMNSFLKPSKALNELIRGMGYASASAFFQTKSLGEVLAFVQEQVEGNSAALGQLFPNIRAIRGVVGLTSAEFDQYGEALSDIEKATLGAGATQRVLQDQMKSSAFQIRVAKEEIRAAVIAIGSEFAPALVKGADAAGLLAQGFLKIPSPIRAASAGIALFVGGLAALGLVGIQVIKGLQGIKQALDAIKVTGLIASLGPLGITVGLLATAIGVLTFNAVKKHQEHQDAVRDLEQAYKDVEAAISEAKIAGDGMGRADELKAFVDDITEATGKFAEQRKKIEADLEEATRMAAGGGIPSLGTNEEVARIGAFAAKQQADAVADLTEKREALADIERFEEAQVRLLKDAYDDERLSVEKAADFAGLLRESISNGNITTKDAITILDQARLTMSLFVDEEKAAAEETKRLADEAALLSEEERKLAEELAEAKAELQGVVSGMSDAAVDSADFANALSDVTREALEMNGAFASVDDPAAWLQEALGGTDALANGFNRLNAAADLGIISLSEAEQEAIDVANAYAGATQRLDDMSAAIGRDQEEMGKWSAQISLVEDILGSSEDTYSQYVQKLNEGTISQEEFNDAIASGEAHVAFQELDKMIQDGSLTLDEANAIRESANYLIERGVRGMQEERVEMAKQLPFLEALVRDHDRLGKNYEDLNPAQKGFVAALQDEGNQMAINTAIMLKMLEAMGVVEEGTSTRFMDTLAAADPVLGAVFEKLGLIRGAADDLNNSGARIKVDLEDEPGFYLKLNDLEGRLAKLREDRDLLIAINATDTPTFDRIMRQIEAIESETVTLRLAAETGGSERVLESLLGIAYEIDDATGAFVITADDKGSLNRLLREVDMTKEELMASGFELILKTNVEEVDKQIRETYDFLGETFGDEPEYFAFLDFDDNGVADELANGLAPEFENIAKRWTAFLALDSTDAKDDVAFIQSRLDDLNRGAGIDLSVNVDEARLIISAFNSEVNQALLTKDFIMYLDADNSGALDATEIAQTTAENFESTYTAYLQVQATEAETRLHQVEGVFANFTDPKRIEVTVESQAAFEEFLRLNQEQLQDKEIHVRVIEEFEGGLGGPQQGGFGAQQIASRDVTVNQTTQATMKMVFDPPTAQADLDAYQKNITDTPDTETTTFKAETADANTKVDALDTNVAQAKGNIETNTESIETSFTEVGSAATAAAGEANPAIDSIEKNAVDSAQVIAQAGTDSGTGYKIGLMTGLQEATRLAGAEALKLGTAVAVDLFDEGKGTGVSYGEGVAQGIRDSTGAAVTAAQQLAQAATAAGGGAKGFDEGSPSKVGIEQGVHYGEGIEIGIDSTTPQVVSSAEDMAGSVVHAVDDALSSGGETGVDSIRERIMAALDAVQDGIGDKSEELRKTIHKMLAKRSPEMAEAFALWSKDDVAEQERLTKEQRKIVDDQVDVIQKEKKTTASSLDDAVADSAVHNVEDRVDALPDVLSDTDDCLDTAAGNIDKASDSLQKASDAVCDTGIDKVADDVNATANAVMRSAAAQRAFSESMKRHAQVEEQHFKRLAVIGSAIEGSRPRIGNPSRGATALSAGITRNVRGSQQVNQYYYNLKGALIGDDADAWIADKANAFIVPAFVGALDEQARRLGIDPGV